MSDRRASRHSPEGPLVSRPTTADSEIAGSEPDDFNHLFKEWRRTRDPRTRERLIERHISLVHYLARKFRDRGESVDDLVQQGIVGLVNAFDRYDPGRSVKFTTYATPMIVGEIKRYFRDKSRRMKVPRRLQELNIQLSRAIENLTQGLHRSPTIPEIAEALGTSEERIVEALEISLDMVSLDEDIESGDDDHSPHSLGERLGTLDEAIEVLGTRSHVEDALNMLNVRERAVVRMHFFEGMSQSDIAKRIGISQMQVSRLKHAAMTRLKKHLRGGEA